MLKPGLKPWSGQGLTRQALQVYSGQRRPDRRKMGWRHLYKVFWVELRSGSPKRLWGFRYYMYLAPCPKELLVWES